MTDLQQRIEQRGDVAEFRALYLGFGACLKAYFMRHGARPVLAETLTREAVLTGWHHASNLADPAHVAMDLIFAKARNLMIDRIMKGFAWHEDHAGAESKKLRPHRVMPSNSKEVLIKLPAPVLEILTMAYLEGASNLMIAHRLEISQAEVRNHLSHAHNKLCPPTQLLTDADGRETLLKISHHPDPTSLIYYAAGNLEEGLSAVVATHIDLCPACQTCVANLERIGALLVMTLRPQQLDQAVPALTLRALEADVFSLEAAKPENLRDRTPPDLTGILAGFVGERFDDLTWNRQGLGIWQRLLRLSRATNGGLRLFKLAPGRHLPQLKHNTHELTLILHGRYHLDGVHFSRGDVIDKNADSAKTPLADEFEGCIALQGYAITSSTRRAAARVLAKLTGVFTRTQGKM